MSTAIPSIGTPLSPVSPQAFAVRTLIIVTVSLCAAIGLLVTALVLYAVVRYRDRGDGAQPRQTGGNRKVELAYTLIPLGIQAGLFSFTVMTMRAAEPPVYNGRPDLVIVAHQWWWELHYPGAGIVSANEIHLPAGRQVLTALQSADVIHELWIPRMGPKMDAVPGLDNRLRLEANQPAVYLGNCAEFCGVGHAWMRLRVVVQSPADFAAWERQMSQPPPPMFGEAKLGREFFQTHTCIQCHTIEGLGPPQDVGPDLTHFASRATLGAGAAPNTPEELGRWLNNPQSIKPGCYMPHMQLSSSEIKELTAYLEALK
ncbi:MAG TPA: cytochrome c oxidase subunit II [Tepidisphaeraceae bacterium]|nr:cytochrome c oxidase subunit II [Tepidisphaeraceae bacterium]